MSLSRTTRQYKLEILTVTAALRAQTIHKLSDYEDADHLGRQIELFWRNNVHGNVGRDMNDPAKAPRDPAFPIWQINLDSNYDTLREIKGQK